MYVDKLNAYASILQRLASLHCSPYEMSGGEYDHVGTLYHLHSLAYLEFLVGRGEHRHRGTSETEIYRTVVSCRGYSGRFGLVIVARVDYHHSGKHLHKAQIFHHLMSGAILPEGYPGMRGGYLDIGTRISHRLTHLIVNASRHELGERPYERYLAGGSQTRTDAYHVSLGYTGLKKAIGKLFPESVHLEGAGKVGTHGDHIAALAPRLQQTGTETGTSIFLLCIFKSFHREQFLIHA